MLSHDVTYEKLPGWNKGRADRGLGCGDNGTICLHSNVIRIDEEDTTKRKKVTITSSKNEKNKQTNKQTKQAKKGSGPSCHASVESRIIQSQEPKSAGETMTRKKKREEISPRFPRVRFLKNAPVPTI